MEFRDLKRQYSFLKDEIDQNIQQVITSTAFINGKFVLELEEKLANYVGKKYCITCANGTDALSLVLNAWGIGPGDAVFVPDFTFFASGEVVSYAGATPVFVDVCMDTFNIDPEKLELAISAVLEEGILSPKVIIPVDLFGLPADYSSISNIAKKYNMKILEDAAQGFGAQIENYKACSFGDASATSFFPAKPLGCYGDGGAIFTDDYEEAEYIKSVRVHGKGSGKYDNVRIGVNSRLDTIQAAVLLPKFRAFQECELKLVNEVANLYSQKLVNIVSIPYIPSGMVSSWAQYTVRLPENINRKKLQAYLNSYNIPSMVYYPKPMHEQLAFSSLKQYQNCSNTAKLCETVLSLPIHPYMYEDEVSLVVEKITNFFKLK